MVAVSVIAREGPELFQHALPDTCLHLCAVLVAGLRNSRQMLSLFFTGLRCNILSKEIYYEARKGREFKKCGIEASRPSS